MAVSEETLHYQVSWHLPNEEASSQSFDIQIYDEDTFEEYKKVCISFVLLPFIARCLQDVRNGGSGSSVQPLFTITHYHPGNSKKFPISSETVALGLGILAFYYTAFVFRTELKPTL